LLSIVRESGPVPSRITNKNKGEDMSTIEQTKSQSVKESESQSVEVQALALIDLLEGASTHASKDKSLRALNSVQLESEGAGYLVARSTDRYRLIEGKIEVEYGQLSPSLIALDDVKRVIAIAKEGKVSGKVSITRIADLLTVSINGCAITLTLLDANYPTTFDDLLNKSEREQLGEIAFNPALFADYAKIAGKGNAVRVEFTGKGKPYIIHLPVTKVEWRALLMPMRVI
jgi:DNA polymerase III sliding clamp (beta) subunit (PCNA family)